MPEPRVLVVDDHSEMAEMLADGLTDRGYRAVAVTSGREAVARLEAESFDALVTDLRMQGMDGLDLLGRSLALDADRPVILMTAYGAIDGAIDAIRRGAYHYLAKPFKLDELVLFLERALAGVRVRREAATLRRELAGRSAPAGMLGRSKPMRVVFDIVERVADAPASVLITGETGTGKGVVAAALHARSGRARAPFVTVNCAALPEPLLESELFGHVKGAFTGATANRTGLFVDADGGTLFLDEIGDMAVSLQAKLLRAIESGKVRAVGEGRERSVDVRIIAATHHDLRAVAAKGTFREDLLYRLDVVTIEMPALRERPDDIPELAQHFIAQAKAAYPRSPVLGVGRDAMARLLDYRWPGNVRELAHVLERAVLLGRDEEIALADLPPQLRQVRARPATFSEVMPMRELQRRYAAWVLGEVDGVRNRAADKLDIDIKTLVKLLHEE